MEIKDETDYRRKLLSFLELPIAYVEWSTNNTYSRRRASHLKFWLSRLSETYDMEFLWIQDE